MTTVLSTLISLVIGSILVVNGMGISGKTIISEAKSAVNKANVHQLATVIELYYSDHNQYPDVSNGEALINTLEKEGYIMNRPLDPAVFDYQPKDNNQDYSLKLKE